MSVTYTKSKFDFIIPAAGVNYCTDPELLNWSNESANGVSYNTTTEEYLYGSKGMKITPGSPSQRFMVLGHAGRQDIAPNWEDIASVTDIWCLSCYVYIPSGQSFTTGFSPVWTNISESGAYDSTAVDGNTNYMVLATEQPDLTILDQWQRISIAVQFYDIGTDRLAFDIRSVTFNAASYYFYADGFQVENITDQYNALNLTNPSSFISGWQPNCYWGGDEDSGFSYRYDNGEGGITVNLALDLKFPVLDVQGIGAPDIDNILHENAIVGGEGFDKQVAGIRKITLMSDVIGDSLSNYHLIRQKMVKALLASNGVNNEFTTLSYSGAQEPKTIKTLYDSGLNINTIDGMTEPKVNLKLIANRPDFRGVGRYIQTMVKSATYSTNKIYWEDENGIIQTIDPQVSSGTIYDIAVYNNRIYIVGTFTNAGGVSSADYAAYYDFGDNAWHGTGVETGGSLTGSITACAVDKSGMLYVSGTFTAFAGGAKQRFAYYNPSTETWAGPSSGLNAAAVKIRPQTILNPVTGSYYTLVGLVGSFTSAGGITVPGIALWNKTSSSFQKVANMSFFGSNTLVTDMLILPYFPRYATLREWYEYNVSPYSENGCEVVFCGSFTYSQTGDYYDTAFTDDGAAANALSWQDFAHVLVNEEEDVVLHFPNRGDGNLSGSIYGYTSGAYYKTWDANDGLIIIGTGTGSLFRCLELDNNNTLYAFGCIHDSTATESDNEGPPLFNILRWNGSFWERSEYTWPNTARFNYDGSVFDASNPPFIYTQVASFHKTTNELIFNALEGGYSSLAFASFFSINLNFDFEENNKWSMINPYVGSYSHIIGKQSHLISTIYDANQVKFNRDGLPFWIFDDSSTRAAQNTINYKGTARCYPQIIISGSGTLYYMEMKNTGGLLIFNRLIQSGEIITIDLTPENFSIKTLVANPNYILRPESTANLFYLSPNKNRYGAVANENIIEVLAHNSLNIKILWSNFYNSID